MLICTNNQIHDINHKLTNKFVQFAVKYQIGLVYIGNPSRVEKTKKCRQINQKLSNWSYSEHIKMLQSKLDLFNIHIKLIDENYTSQTCPCCGRRNKCSNRNYRYTYEYVSHRDVRGAKNILNKGLYHRIFTKGLVINSKPDITYLRSIKLN